MTCWKFKKKIAECIDSGEILALLDKEKQRKTSLSKNQKAPALLG